VAIPSLRHLQSQAGLPQPQPPPELVLEQHLLAGGLPAGTDCVSCGTDTPHVLEVTLECERARVTRPGELTWGKQIAMFLVSPLLAVLANILETRGEPREYGKDKVYVLPLRMCTACARDLAGRGEVKAWLAAVPVYRRLLEKYPGAKVKGLEARVSP
jgi:hypothetical protein